MTHQSRVCKCGLADAENSVHGTSGKKSLLAFAPYLGTCVPYLRETVYRLLGILDSSHTGNFQVRVKSLGGTGRDRATCPSLQLASGLACAPRVRPSQVRTHVWLLCDEGASICPGLPRRLGAPVLGCSPSLAGPLQSLPPQALDAYPFWRVGGLPSCWLSSRHLPPGPLVSPLSHMLGDG